RRHETEADDYALEKMVQAGIDPVHFANMMRKFMALEANGGAKAENASATENKINSYLSSHPATQERIERALEYAGRRAGS
ncbi:MAG: M48 family metalloprotease, partial [Proteobacteria bacterium]|nr:M48 family metalloprotease [Pseudomonadota bacterium]